ncbi:LysE family translocator [Marinomonas sp. C2222]|uniref:LysE family translocator n=1 Tax=Marinomonas sargassi TaxID=2984494 RepID=A0ABT2YQT8_9GAMM|nr:LysE family translocator [Marinomonas sargassi]MCV2402259.1 LysE family translocator [Marinomonas sargassi]
MSLETWLLFFVAYLIVTLSPGPNVLLVVKNAVRHGYKAASVTILMNLLCQLFIIILVALGAGALLASSPMLFFLLKLIGGVYLIYLGVTGLLSKRNSRRVGVKEVITTFSYRKLSKEAFFVSASNPKTVIFLSAFLPQFLSPDSSILIQFGAMFLTICFIVALVHLAYSYITKNISNKWSELGSKKLFSNITNSAFIAFGCGVLFSHRAT